jgi:hypothetical protein
MRDFNLSFFVTLVCVGLAAAWGLQLTGSSAGAISAVGLVLILGVMEVSLSFDNAVVNASVLKTMDAYWQKLFLTVGILVAVFGMRLLFPIAIVSVTTGLGFFDVGQMALANPEEYSQRLHENHTVIAAFGGTFLFLVFLSFLLDEGKELHWLGKVEESLSKLGKIDSIGIIITLILLMALQHYLPISEQEKSTLLLGGVAGLVLYVIVNSLGDFFESEQEGDDLSTTVVRSGAMSFVYLEILDASFSFDGVIGAFAVTRDVVIIMLGLAIGAMFVRSLTVHLVKKGTLDEYVFLEHGAHYGIGVLALIMFYSIYAQVPEMFTGLVGLGFILAALISSLIYKKTHSED